jgi:hypothetical protein
MLALDSRHAELVRHNVTEIAYALDRQIEWLQAQERAAAARRTTQVRARIGRRLRPPAARAAARPRTGDAWLDCIGAHESDNAGGYQATDAGHAGAEENSGRYSFSQSTWDSTARHIGRYDLVGIRPMDASPADQDAMALALHAWQGGQPWAGSGCS